MDTTLELIKSGSKAFWQGFTETPAGMIAMLKGAWQAGMEFGRKH